MDVKIKYKHKEGEIRECANVRVLKLDYEKDCYISMILMELGEHGELDHLVKCATHINLYNQELLSIEIKDNLEEKDVLENYPDCWLKGGSIKEQILSIRKDCREAYGYKHIKEDKGYQIPINKDEGLKEITGKEKEETIIGGEIIE